LLLALLELLAAGAEAEKGSSLACAGAGAAETEAHGSLACAGAGAGAGADETEAHGSLLLLAGAGAGAAVEGPPNGSLSTLPEPAEAEEEKRSLDCAEDWAVTAVSTASRSSSSDPLLEAEVAEPWLPTLVVK